MNLNWVNICFLSATAAGVLILPPLDLYLHGWHWGLFAAFLVSAFATNVSITAGYHRYLAHRSYEAQPWVKLAFLLVGAAAFQGSALVWGADHRRHHRFVDTDRDPHNINKGFFWAHCGWLLVKEAPENRSPIPPDLANDSLIAWQHRWYVPIATFMGFILPTLIGAAFGHAFGAFVWCGVLRVFVTNHCTFFINSLAHYVGDRPYNDQTARDSLLMAFLACGEGYHNYHHQFASDYRNGIRWYQWDPTKWLIRSMSLVGWTYRLKRVPPTTILEARLRKEKETLLRRGYPAERVEAMKRKLLDAQLRFRSLRDDYGKLKRDMERRSRERLVQLKLEMKSARADFKRASAQWGTFKKQPAWAYA